MTIYYIQLHGSLSEMHLHYIFLTLVYQLQLQDWLFSSAFTFISPLVINKLVCLYHIIYHIISYISYIISYMRGRRGRQYDTQRHATA